MDYLSVYTGNDGNSAQITAGASGYFFQNQSDKEATIKWGQSFNYLEINNFSSREIAIYLDGLATRIRKISGKSNLVIKPEEEIFFNNVKITNLDGASAIAANELVLIARIMKPIPTISVGVK
jgi:hypothetical protein